MAERRMFAKSIVQSGKFLKMPVSSRELYFQMGMTADDDGVVEAWNVMKLTAATEDDLRVLVSKGFVQILNNDDMIAYLTDWESNNSIRKDRYHEGQYKGLKLQVLNMVGNQLSTGWQPSDNQTTTEVSIGKSRLVKYSLLKDNIPASESHADTQCESWFTSFWDSYPKKKDKANAVKAFRKVCKTEEDYNTIMSGLMNQIPLWKDPQYIPYPATWLNGKRWEDDLSTDKQKAMSPMQKFLYGGLDER